MNRFTSLLLVIASLSHVLAQIDIISVTATTASGVYTPSSPPIFISVNFVNPAFVNASATNTFPYLILSLGTANNNTLRYANYSSGSGSTSLVFNYTILPGDDMPLNAVLDYASPNALQLNGALIRSGTYNLLNVTLPFPGSGMGRAIRLDTVAPTVVSVSVITPPALAPVSSLIVGPATTIWFAVNVSEPVYVTWQYAISLIVLRFNSSVGYATFQSGSGTTSLLFAYTTQGTEWTTQLDYNNTNALLRQGLSLKDSAGYDLVTTLPSPGSAGSISASGQVQVWARPDVTSTLVCNPPFTFLSNFTCTFTPRRNGASILSFYTVYNSSLYLVNAGVNASILQMPPQPPTVSFSFTSLVFLNASCGTYIMRDNVSAVPFILPVAAFSSRPNTFRVVPRTTINIPIALRYQGRSVSLDANQLNFTDNGGGGTFLSVSPSYGSTLYVRYISGFSVGDFNISVIVKNYLLSNFSSQYPQYFAPMPSSYIAVNNATTSVTMVPVLTLSVFADVDNTTLINCPAYVQVGKSITCMITPRKKSIVTDVVPYIFALSLRAMNALSQFTTQTLAASRVPSWYFGTFSTLWTNTTAPTSTVFWFNFTAANVSSSLVLSNGFTWTQVGVFELPDSAEATWY
eukprot:TRINITY_DN717_c0_g2_i1.p1 TRINITY_DN717_c0_g2~~TRINITY_DN717_c0_g2_i1.p1  ORF type:complete len:656 (+),score=257.25 TRINITY_DN717_c0_g2_i1:77-1969(+)